MKNNMFNKLLLSLALVNLIFSILNLNIYYILLSFIIFIITFFNILKKEIFKNINLSLIFLFLILCIFGSSRTFNKYQEEDFINKNYNEIYMYAKENDIKLKVNYEYSDKLKKNRIINYTFANNLLNLVVSEGPNYNKKIIIPNLEYKSTKFISNFIASNYMSNIKIRFIENDGCDRNKLISQSIIGTMLRNEEITFDFCKSKNYKKEINLDLLNANKYEAILKILSNNYTYGEKYVFSNIIEKNKVVKSELLEKDNKIIIYISKGNKIIIPNFKEMELGEIYRFIIKNNLNVEFKYIYDEEIKKGKFISSNVKEGNLVSEIDKIVIYFSKGELILPNFKKLSEFKNFANKNNIKYRIRYIEKEDVKPNIITNYSVTPGSKINGNKEIIVYLSKQKDIIKPTNKKTQETTKNTPKESVSNQEQETIKKDTSLLDLFE